MRTVAIAGGEDDDGVQLEVGSVGGRWERALDVDY